MNKVNLTGVISSEFVFDHEIYDEKFYKTYLVVTRKSGAQDELPLIVSERLLRTNEEYVGCEVDVIGQLRSRNVIDGKKGHLVLSVFVSEISITNMVNEENVNHIALEGFLCKAPTYKKTPSGREISDILVAVNRRNGKSDYLPCVAWGRNAVFASMLPVGSMVSIEGRVQSREYTKVLNDNERETRIAYEVSVSRLNVQD